MSNKLKKIFNHNERILTGKVIFKDAKSKQEFSDALKEAYKTGQSVKVEGVESMSFGVDSGAGLFPLDKHEKITDLMVGVSPEQISIPLNVDDNVINFPLVKYQIENGVIFRTSLDFLFDINFRYDAVNQTAKLKYTPQIQRADGIESILDGVETARALLDKFFSDTSHNNELKLIYQNLQELYDLFEKLKYIEETFQVKINPQKVDLTDEDSQRDLFELYLAIHDKKAIKMSLKLIPDENTIIPLSPESEPKVNDPIAITMRNRMEFSIWGEHITIFTANLICNAIIKSVDCQNDKNVIVYGDTEYKPMYISYKGFVTEDEAIEEMSGLIKNKDEYEVAKTIEEYWHEENNTH